MKHIILIFTLTLTLINISIAQNFEWTKTIGGSGSDNGIFITTDNLGNIYTTGSFEGTIEIGSETIISNGEKDIFISKTDENGNLLWIKSIGGSGSDEGYSIYIDDSDNIYLTGPFEGTVDFDPNLNNSTVLTSNGYRDVFILKLETDGKFVWAKNVGSGSNDYGVSITADNSGNVYTTGYFGDEADFDPNSGVESMVALSWDVFVLKLDLNGDFVWAKQFGGGSEDKGNTILLDNTGNIYIAGVYTSLFTDYTSTNPSDFLLDMPKTDFADMFILKLDPDGNSMWAKQIGGGNYYSRQSIKLDNNDNVYAIGSFDETEDFDPGIATFEMTSMGKQDIFITKLDKDGNFVWAKQFGGSEDDHSYAIDIDENGDLFLSGDFKGIADFDPGINQYNLTASGQSDAFITKLDADGNFIWAKQYGGLDSDYGNYLSVDSYNNIYLTGSFKGTVNFNTENGSEELSASGENDIYILKLNQKILTSSFHNEFDSNVQTKAYPNPTNGNIIIQINKDFSHGEIFLRNISGQVIKNQSIKQSLISDFSIDSESGVYILEIIIDQQKEAYKIIKK